MATGPIRQAVTADVPAVARLTEAAYAPHAARIGMRPAPMDADHAADVAAGRVWVVDGDAGPVAAIVLAGEPGYLLVESVAVDPAVQGAGLGRRLMAHAEAQAAARGYAEVRLYTNVLMTANVAWYPRLGYEETERREEDGFARVFFRKRLA